MNLIVLSIPVFFSLIALEVAWDQWRKLGLYRLGDTLANIGCGIMDQSSGLFSKVVVVAAYTAVFHASEGWRSWTVDSSPWVWIVAFVCSDFAYYWAHRLSHQVNLLWVGHSVHHQSEDYNLGVALRQSVLQKILLMLVYWPLAALGFPPAVFLTCMAINLLYQFWIHTELIQQMGPLEWVMNTPSHHRVHHGRNPEYIDRNHAGVFIVWDRMFGTFQKERVKPTYGVTRPTDSFNPVYAQWKPVSDLWQDLRTIPGLWDKLRFLLSPPGWYPESLGGAQNAPAITGEEQKYNPKPSARLTVVLMGRWLMLLGMALLALENKETISTMELAGALTWVFCALAAVGELWNKGWSRGRLALSWTVDLSFVPAAVLLSSGLGWGYAPWVFLAGLSASATTWALWASSKR